MLVQVGRYAPELLEMFDFRAERVIRSVDESLARLGTGYIDCIQVPQRRLEVGPSTSGCAGIHSVRYSTDGIYYLVLLCT